MKQAMSVEDKHSSMQNVAQQENGNCEAQKLTKNGTMVMNTNELNQADNES